MWSLRLVSFVSHWGGGLFMGGGGLMPAGGAILGGGGYCMPIYYGGYIIPYGGRAMAGPLIGAGPLMGMLGGGAPMPTPLPGPASPAGA